MVIKGKEGGGGERMGTILLVIKAFPKEKKVVVRHLDGAPAGEESPFHPSYFSGKGDMK